MRSASRISGTVSTDVPGRAGNCGGEPGLLFVVSDTGVGMSADTALRLFERSHLPERGPARDPMRQGTGLGLRVAYRLMRLMDGDITVDSTPGQGSVFRVTPAAARAVRVGRRRGRSG